MKIKGLDEIDNKIVNLLSENARISYSAIGELVGLTRTAVRNRINEMTETGIIKGYHAVINTQKRSPTNLFAINIATDAKNFDNVKEKLKNKAEILSIIQTSGTFDLRLICALDCKEEVSVFINEVQKQILGIKKVNVYNVLDIIKGDVF